MSEFKLQLREDRPATIEEHRALRDEIERLQKENFAFAAGLCPHHYGDEYGHSGCREIDRLREQLVKAHQIFSEASFQRDCFHVGGVTLKNAAGNDMFIDATKIDAAINEIKALLQSDD